MSQWRLIVKALSAGPATSGQLAFLGFNPHPACQRAKHLGLIQLERHGRVRHWRLTEEGQGYLAGSVKLIERPNNNGRRPKCIAPVPSDDTLISLLLDSGHEPETAVTAPVLREFSARLVKLVREGVAA